MTLQVIYDFIVGDFNANITKTNANKFYKYKAKLLGNTVAQLASNAAKEILENATIAVPLKYLSNFGRSVEVTSINCKVELKLRWTKHCVFYPCWS